MTELKEGKLNFQFDNNWDIVIDYDKNTNPVSDYARYFQNDKVTAVDFVASKTNTSGTKQVFLIEVKDYRGYEIKAPIIENINLSQVISDKVKDIIISEESSINEEVLEGIVKDAIKIYKDYLPSTIAKNVRDTLYGIIIGNRNCETANHNEWINLLEIMKNKDSQIVIILWLEANLNELQPNPPQLHTILQNLKRKLSKLTDLVNICRIGNNSVSGLNVTPI